MSELMKLVYLCSEPVPHQLDNFELTGCIVLSPSALANKSHCHAYKVYYPESGAGRRGTGDGPPTTLASNAVVLAAGEAGKFEREVAELRG
jgi:hypothetical protein